MNRFLVVDLSGESYMFRASNGAQAKNIALQAGLTVKTLKGISQTEWNRLANEGVQTLSQ